ncbi:hypothetical membrane protein [Thermococcus kodakarensis KOD1]|uniref:Hypothetical membrane protein n=1 Tax=Thermococcus kodakarensis (strain ATCC BAA-918 / JCM 12380 / KOD1) TaxID=69014 RepID=Q5JER2_THEKO|nr:hypothetical membrane protein [Thermococcus kodakarensis KOD1]
MVFEVNAVKEYVRLLFLLRLFLRVFAFGYPLFLTVMYNFWIFTRIPSWALVVYIVVMDMVELTVLIFSEKPWIGALTKVYLALAIVFEFPSAVVELPVSGRIYGYAPFFGWALLWYLPVFLICVFSSGLGNDTMKAKPNDF